ncbi:hypothetical protein MTR67_038124 [Solanum verrucosum]|uniref:Uncharacterized protein n=1 Tax=Solanum verrucosum TaxID=315347 RepID=A0AAF0UF69_SOLVR|nr:hypothetical protein MTR67_038124 [Solanum verrucosum]
MEGMNIQIIKEEDYEIDISIAKAREIHELDRTTLFKCKGCKLGGIEFSTVEQHFRECKFLTNNYGYRQEEDEESDDETTRSLNFFYENRFYKFKPLSKDNPSTTSRIYYR